MANLRMGTLREETRTIGGARERQSLRSGVRTLRETYAPHVSFTLPRPCGHLRLLALELFREDKVSLGRAAELCQTPLAAFMDFAAHHDVPPLRYGSADLAEERLSIERLGV